METIEVTIHPQSIVHSLVEFQDRSMKAQLSVPDMRAAIAYALSYPERMELDLAPLDFGKGLCLEFFPPDAAKFPALSVARSAMSRPDVLPCILNAADETAVDAFLSGRIGFTMITEVVKKTMDILSGSTVDSPEDIMELDKKSRKIAEANL
jgi:1-deoxy-D-xylulose-5-phosphate reductoisomerase